MVHLFEHEYSNYRFWHGVVDVDGSSQAIENLFKLGELGDIKIRVKLDDGRTALTPEQLQETMTKSIDSVIDTGGGKANDVENSREEANASRLFWRAKVAYLVPFGTL